MLFVNPENFFRTTWARRTDRLLRERLADSVQESIQLLVAQVRKGIAFVYPAHRASSAGDHGSAPFAFVVDEALEPFDG